MIDFPGYNQSDDIEYWFEITKVIDINNDFAVFTWLVLNTFSTVITLYSLTIIFKTVRELKNSGTTFKLNKTAWIINLIILIATCLAVLTNVISYFFTIYINLTDIVINVFLCIQ